MPNRLVSVGDDFTLPAAVVVADANLPAASNAAAVAAKQDAATLAAAVAAEITTPGSAVAGALSATILDKTGSPDDAGYDIVLLLGQSNMSGWAIDGDPRIDPIHAKVWQYGTAGTYADVVSQAIEPLAMVDTPAGMGPGLTFARWYADSAPKARRVLLVPVAKGGSTFEGASSPAGWTWKVGRSDVVNLYDLAIVQAGKALAAAGPNSRIVAALWLQGETDGDRATSGATYQADFDALVTGMRTALGLPNLPFVVGQMVPEYLATGTRYAVNDVHADTPNRLAKTAFSWAPFAANRGDGNHFTAKGQRIIGRSMYDAYRRIVTGTPDPALPAAPAAVTGAVASNITDVSATITWTAVPTAGAYYVERSISPFTSWTVAGTPTTSSAAVTGLVAGVENRIRVRAINNKGFGPNPAANLAFTTAAPPSLSDTFTRADSSAGLGTATSGQTWTYLDGGTWGISSNQGTMATFADRAKAVLPYGASDQIVNITVPTLTWVGTPSTENIGVIARLFDVGNYYTATVAANGSVSLFKRVANAYTLLGTATAAGSFVAGNKLGISAVGTTIKALINDAAVITVTDSAISTGSVGIRNAGLTTGKLWDNFSAVAG